jgi:hypothetical protein
MARVSEEVRAMLTRKEIVFERTDNPRMQKIEREKQVEATVRQFEINRDKRNENNPFLIEEKTDIKRH